MTYSFDEWKAGKPLPKGGWDAADAIQDGWSKADLDAFMRGTVKPWPFPGKRARAEREDKPEAESKRTRTENTPDASPVAEMRDPDEAEPVDEYVDSIPTGCGLPLSEHPRRDDILRLREWAFLSADCVFYNVRTSETMSKTAFDLAMAPITPSVEIEKDDGTTTLKKFPASKTLIEYLGGEVVSHTMYAPNMGDRFFIADGIRFVNSYLRRTVPATADKWEDHPAWKVCHDHIEHVFTGNAKTLIQWMAHNVQFPGVKILWSPILIGVEGDGKTTIANMLKVAMGRPNVQDVSVEALFSDFNSWAEGACVRVMDEIRVPGERRSAAMNKLKPVITNETVEVVRKGKDGKEIINVTNYIAMSNHVDALALTENDRRWAVMKTRFSSKAQKDEATGDRYWEDLANAWRNNSGVIRGWLMNVDLSDFNRTIGPAMTGDKLEMIEASRGAADADIREAIALGGEGVSNEVIATDCLNERVKEIGGRSLNTSSMANILRESGWTKLETTIKWKAKTRRVYYRADAMPDGADGATLVQHIRGLLDLTGTESGDHSEPDQLPW